MGVEKYPWNPIAKFKLLWGDLPWDVPPLPGSKCDKSNKWPWPGKENTHSLTTDPEDANPRGFTTTKGGREGPAGMLKKNWEETYFQWKDSIKNSVNDGRCILFLRCRLCRQS